MTANLDRLDRMSPVGAVTTFEPVVAGPGDDLGELARLMTDADCGSLLVRGPDDQIAIVTERDIVRAIAADASEAWAVDVMSRGLICVPAELSIAEAAATMLEAGIRHLAVERSDGQMGITSIRDLIDAFLSEDE